MEKSTVKIGNQVWMAENLNVEKFRNGDPIPEAKTDEEWEKAGKNEEPAWCYYDNDPSNGTKYGKLYNWYAVNDPRGLAPEGWKISSDEEWSVLSTYLGGEEVAGGKMKSTDTQYFGFSVSDSEQQDMAHTLKTGDAIKMKNARPNGDATNESGFSGLPGGFRTYGTFGGIGLYGSWWTSTEADTEESYYRNLRFNDGSSITGADYKKSGFSVRCLRD